MLLFLISSLFLWADFCDLTLDPNTAHNRLSLLEGNKKLLYNSIYISQYHILIIQRDLTTISRFGVKRVCLDAVTGSLNGAGRVTLQCHIKVVAVGLEAMKNPVFYAASGRNWLPSIMLFKYIYIPQHLP